MSDSPDPRDMTQRADDPGPVVGPDDVDPVDHTVDEVEIDGETGSIPGEWL